MSDYELRNAREWDSVSSARHSSRLSLPEEFEDGFTKVQGSKKNRQEQAQATHSTKTPTHANVNGQNNTYANRPPPLTNGFTNGRGGSYRGRGRGRGRGAGVSDHLRERPTNPVPAPSRSTTQRHVPKSAAELARESGEPATCTFSFSIPRRSGHHQFQTTKSISFKAELTSISRKTATYIEESSVDVYSVLIWGDDDKVRQAVLRLQDLDRGIQPEKWAKNPAFDGRRENRRELKAQEEEQATRLRPFADSQEYPFEYSFVWPDSELSLQHVIETHDKPRGAFEDLRRTHQCSIRYDLANSSIIVQGMQERDIVAAGRTFEALARQMIAEMSLFIKISLMAAPTAVLYQPFVSMDQKVDLKSTLYYQPTSQGFKPDTFTVRTPKLWTHLPPAIEEAKSRSEKMARRLHHLNRKTIIAGLDRSLTNLHFVQKAVRMQVDFGQLAFLRYFSPQSGSQHHTFEDFRKTMAKDRTDLLLQGMPPNVQITSVVEYLIQHPALKNHDETFASVVETYVVAFDFRRADSHEVLRHEQEFGASYKNDEMEMRRRSWVRIGDHSNRTSPIVLSVLDFEKLDWQLRIQAHDILDPRYMSKEYAEFEAGVGVSATSSPAGITGPPSQRATFPRGHRDLVRVINKPVIQFKLGKTDHILEIAREDVYETDPFQTSPPNPESKWTASFYYSKWVNDLGEFAYKKHGERPSWEPSLSTFFPEGDDIAPQPNKKPKGPRNFLNEIEEVKSILWEATRRSTDDENGNLIIPSERMGTVGD